ncbi:MAG: excinuclease ABC subunit UvrA [Thermodesulfovibrionales bacterium]|nr:excinuclease ABC subunit UvrA [Thermodesulfovibrionales bacterium]
MSERELIIEGARQNNLKNITLRLPHDKVIAVTGVSGSGKSSLAFDTIFAEGQWRFIESLSTYARLFLEKLDRPDVDAIHNIRPAIALEQKNPVKGSRSTVGTLTEIYDLLRVLYSKISTPFCPQCGNEIRKWDPSQVKEELIEKYTGKKAIIIFASEEPVEALKQRGFHRAWVNGEITELSAVSGQLSAELINTKNPPIPPLPKGGEGGFFEIVLDRLVIKDEPRLSDSIEMAWKEGNGKAKVILIDTVHGSQFTVHSFSSENVCDNCNIELPEPSPLLFSFNHPIGACPECKGFGNTLIYDEDLIIPDKHLSLAEGAIAIWEKPIAKWWKKQMIAKAKKSAIDIKKPYIELSQAEKEKIFKGAPDFYGIDDFFGELETKRYKLHVRVFLSRHRRPVTCPSCNGKRLGKEALSYKISELDIAEVCDLPVSGLIKFFRDADISSFQRNLAKELLRQINLKLQFLNRVGLDYLGLNRQGKTLSGGEYQRVNLSNQLSSLLTGTLYVLDEPTVGLHPRDTERIAKIMAELSGLGNTIIVVEHDRDIINSADWIVELGPGGGHQGGEVVFSGPKDKFLKADTLTAKYITGVEKVEHQTRDRISGAGSRNKRKLILYGAEGNNLKSVDLKIPVETLTTVTGVSGSGKSSLVVETLYGALARHFKLGPEFPLPYKTIEGMEYIRNVKLIDQTPTGKSPRSNAVTYLKIFDPIRKIFSEQHEAKAYGYTPGFFSFNVTGGRCEACKGEGYQKMEMYFFEDLYIKCEECNGKRYKPEALRVAYHGKNINDVLSMTVDEAADFFSDVPQIQGKFSLMKDIGLGYIRIGQPATTFSGGEAQRLKICAELSQIAGVRKQRAGISKTKTPNSKPGCLYILDEPTVGLHFSDVKALLNILQRLVDAGNSVLVIEHNLDVIQASDWIIDLGPEGGDKGGRIIFEGTPEQIIKARESYTGRYLKESLKYRE